MNTLLLISAFVAAALIGQMAVLAVAARAGRLPRRRWWRAFVIVLVRFTALVGIWVLIATYSTAHQIHGVFWSLASVADLAAGALLVRLLYRGRVRGTVMAVSVQYLGGFFLWAALGVAFNCVLETENGDLKWMSPNIRGFHVVRELADEKHLVVDADSDLMASISKFSGGDGNRPSIIAETYEIGRAPKPISPEFGPDRLVCNKTKPPDRWDAVLHCTAKEPNSRSIRRVVGLPGEQVRIHDGSVWVGGERQVPPTRLGALWMRSDDDQEPVRVLGPDEFLLIGDSEHPSRGYPLVGPLSGDRLDSNDHVFKRDEIIGIVDLIYWPPARWRVQP